MSLSVYPSVAANILAKHCGLYNKDENFMTSPEPEIVKQLRYFEQVSASGSFNDCMIAFTGKKLTAKQKKTLKVLYGASRAWVNGMAMDNLFRIMSGGDKEAVAAAKILFEKLMPEGAEAEATASILNIHVNPSADKS